MPSPYCRPPCITILRASFSGFYVAARRMVLSRSCAGFYITLFHLKYIDVFISMQTAHWTLKLIIIRPSFHSGKDPKNCPVEIKYFAYAPCF